MIRGASEFLRRLRAMFSDEASDRRRAIEALRVRIDTELFQRFEIGPALDNLIGFFLIHSRLSVRRMASSMPLMKRTESSALKVRPSSRASLMTTIAGVSGSWRNS